MDSPECQSFYDKVIEERLIEIIKIDLNTNNHVKKFIREFLENFLRSVKRELVHGRRGTLRHVRTTSF